MAIILIHESVFLSVVFRLLVFLHIEMFNGLEGIDNLYELVSVQDFISSCICCIALGHFMDHCLCFNYVQYYVFINPTTAYNVVVAVNAEIAHLSIPLCQLTETLTLSFMFEPL